MDHNNRTTFTLSRRIGSTNYRVSAHFNEAASETLEDKILRIVQNEAGANNMACGIMVSPQTSRESERSA